MADTVIVTGCSSADFNGSFIIQSVGSTTFTYSLTGADVATVTPGVARIERIGLAASGSKIYASSAINSSVSRIKGAYIWDKQAPFQLSSYGGNTVDAIRAGKIVRLLNISTNDIPFEGGHLIFDYGLSTQEGPVRYLYKPTDGVIALDPSYTFQFNHSIGSSIAVISKMGPHTISANGSEYAPYITDPSQARAVLENLIKSVKSAGIFVNFLINYPEQLYGLLDVYNQQELPRGAGAPFNV